LRPKKTRLIRSKPKERLFKPVCGSLKDLKEVVLSLDELEVLRLSSLDSLDQNKISKRINVHRSTVSRILNSAHYKIADALVNIKKIKIEGGSCKIIEET